MAGRRVSKTSKLELWQMAKNWLASTNILPQGHPVYFPSPTVFDLAHSLRDGVSLCQVANCLRSYAVRYINLKPQMSPFLCLKNIRGFLRACVDIFGLKESVLFDAHELYDVSDFGKVVLTLSHLSKCKDAIHAGLIPFPSDRASSVSTKYTDKDIYGNLEEIALTRDVGEENIFDQVTIEDDKKIYDDVVALKRKIPRDEKKSYVVDELFETEQNYINALTTIKEQFIDRLEGVMNSDDIKTIFVNIKDLLKMHITFLKKLEDARTRKDVGRAISNVFIVSKDIFLVYGTYCREIQSAQNHVDYLCASDPEINRLLLECSQRANGGKFSLRSLLVVPVQRVITYPSLLRKLINHFKNNAYENIALEKALEAMQHVAHYINAVKRDDEILSHVAQVQESLIRPQDKEMQHDLLDLKQFGLLVKDGDIQIKTSEERALKKRSAFLFDRVLLLCKARGEQYDHKETFYLNLYNVSESVASSGKGKFTHGWMMTANSQEAGRSSYEMFTKTDDMKKKWVEDIKRTITNLTLDDYDLGGHQFELVTLNSATYCKVCKNLLCGLINQGYSCKVCRHICHRECIEKSQPCKGARTSAKLKKQTSEPFLPSSPPLPPRTRNKSEPVISPFSSSAVISITRFHGWAPGKKDTLNFETGEEIDVLQSSDPEWWECVGL